MKRDWYVAITDNYEAHEELSELDLCLLKWKCWLMPLFVSSWRAIILQFLFIVHTIVTFHKMREQKSSLICV